MEFFFTFIAFIIIFLGVINLIRMSLLLIGADIYGLKKHLNKNQKFDYTPLVSVIIPAYNEEKSILTSLRSVLRSSYPRKKIEVIIVNDGSTDNTEKIVKKYLTKHRYTNVKLVSQLNGGKAHALNNGLKNYANGELVMCLDADSYLGKDALKKAVKYFVDKRVAALSANVKIVPGKGLLNLVQRFEYLICYQMKKAQTTFNIEYIIGGIGSVFRKSFLDKIQFYDEDTVTEDIDLTMKILRNGNKNVRVIYGSDVVTYTQSVVSISDLIKQRYRWKWGRCQTFFKNKPMFFSREKKFTKGLSWLYLPFALFSDLTFLLEPLLVFYILYLVIVFRDFHTLLAALSVITFYNVMNLLAEETMTIREKIKLIVLSPLMYFLFYILSFVEYVALLKSLVRLPVLKNSLSENRCSWKPVKRSSLDLAVSK